MLILGSGGFAMQILDVLGEDPSYDFSKLAFFNNTGNVSNEYIHGHYRVINDEKDSVAQNDSLEFILGIGNPSNRKSLFNLFSQLNRAVSVQVISKYAAISSVNVRLGEGVCIMPGAVVMGNTEIALGALINCNASIGHDSKLHQFVEVCPGAVISGNCTIGSGTFIGSNAVVFPGVNIGENCIIGAGTIVTRDVPPNQKVIGNPGVARQI
jgi:sugar O-acyltransferase (sialic acid O-acetyltransferase NeuD family)